MVSGQALDTAGFALSQGLPAASAEPLTCNIESQQLTTLLNHYTSTSSGVPAGTLPRTSAWS